MSLDEEIENEVSHSIDKMVKYKAEDPIHTIHEHNFDIKSNHIYLFGEESYIAEDSNGVEPGVEFSMANRFIKNLNILMRKSEEPILIHMKTCGGIWEEGMAIYDAIKACPSMITILNYTHARSMSSLIFQAADKRVMMPNSTFMFHDGTMAYSGTAKQFLTEAKQLERSNRIMIDIYINSLKKKGKFKKRSRQFIENWLREQMDKKEDVYLDAKQAIEYGFADEIFGSDGHYDWKSLTTYDEE